MLCVEKVYLLLYSQAQIHTTGTLQAHYRHTTGTLQAHSGTHTQITKIDGFEFYK